MPNVDQFESMFRAASRKPYPYERIVIGSVLTVTDLEHPRATTFHDSVKTFLSVLDDKAKLDWLLVKGSDFRTAEELLALVDRAKPDLICTYRNLHSSAWRWPYSLGTHLDLLTQHTGVPVMVLPHPDAQRGADHALQRTATVIAVTDHLAGDHRLVNHAVRFTEDGGTLWLSHVEDAVTFERYMDAISKISAIDTEQARQTLSERLLKDPLDYVKTCREVLRNEGVRLDVQTLVSFGHHLAEYEQLVESHQVDLLVMNTKDEDQLAMHGTAYELAVQLRQIPLLML